MSNTQSQYVHLASEYQTSPASERMVTATASAFRGYATKSDRVVYDARPGFPASDRVVYDARSGSPASDRGGVARNGNFNYKAPASILTKWREGIDSGRNDYGYAHSLVQARSQVRHDNAGIGEARATCSQQVREALSTHAENTVALQQQQISSSSHYGLWGKTQFSLNELQMCWEIIQNAVWEGVEIVYQDVRGELAMLLNSKVRDVEWLKE